MSVEFQDFTIKVTEAMEDAALQFLEEAAVEIQSAAQRNSRVASGQLKGSWDYNIDAGAKEAKIGSPLENAIWEEFGKKVLCRIKIGQNRLNFIGKCGKIYL